MNVCFLETQPPDLLGRIDILIKCMGASSYEQTSQIICFILLYLLKATFQCRSHVNFLIYLILQSAFY